MPTRKTIFWIVTAALLYLIAWNIGSGWLYVIISILIAFPLGSLMLSRFNTGGIQVEQVAAERCLQGDAVDASLSVSNRSRLPRFLLRFSCELAGSSTSMLLVSLPAKSSRVLSVTYEDVRRGIYSDGDLELSSKAPFGLSSSRRHLDQTVSLVVYPRWQMLAGDWSSGLMSAGYLLSRTTATRNPTSDYLGVRDYRSEDSPRSIHWKTSARSNRLAVVEYARHTAMTRVFIIDPYRSADIGSGATSSFETCIIAAASLVQREALFNRRFGIGTSLQDAAIMGLGHDSEAAMLKLAGMEADAGRPVMHAETALPWPDATPVLIVTSHRDYAHLDDATIFDRHPQTLVVMVDGRTHDVEGKNNKLLMDDHQIDALTERLALMGGDLILINSRETVATCLGNL